MTVLYVFIDIYIYIYIFSIIPFAHLGYWLGTHPHGSHCCGIT